MQCWVYTTLHCELLCLYTTIHWVVLSDFPAQVSDSVKHGFKPLFEVIYAYYISDIVNYISASIANRRALVSASSTRSSAAGRQTEGLTSVYTSVHCVLLILHYCSLCTVECTLHYTVLLCLYTTIHCVVLSVHCNTMCTVEFTLLYTAYCWVCTLLYTMYYLGYPFPGCCTPLCSVSVYTTVHYVMFRLLLPWLLYTLVLDECIHYCTLCTVQATPSLAAIHPCVRLVYTLLFTVYCLGYPFPSCCTPSFRWVCTQL